MDKIKETRLKLTPQRLAIFEYLEGNTSHPSADDIFAAVKKKFPTMSFATVYNTIETLKSRGEITELTADPDRKRYDPDTSHHHHLICTSCKVIVDIKTKFNVTIPDDKKDSFDVMGTHIEFYGFCPKCQKKRFN